MKNIIDLHMHTTASDGSFTPSELVSYAKEKGLYAIAITDHDTVSGIDEALKQGEKSNIKVIPGIEISCDFKSELHIVGLNIDINNNEFKKEILNLQNGRKRRFDEMYKILTDMGFEITYPKDFSKSIGRAFIAEDMVKRNYVSTVKEAFKKYLGKGQPAFINTERPSYKKAIEIIKKGGGYAILAHCHFLNMENDEFILFLEKLIDAGLDGLEGYYSLYSKEQGEYYRSVAQKYNLKVSGGSDFHGSLKPYIDLGNLEVPKDLLNQFL